MAGKLNWFALNILLAGCINGCTSDDRGPNAGEARENVSSPEPTSAQFDSAVDSTASSGDASTPAIPTDASNQPDAAPTDASKQPAAPTDASNQPDAAPANGPAQPDVFPTDAGPPPDLLLSKTKSGFFVSPRAPALCSDGCASSETCVDDLGVGVCLDLTTAVRHPGPCSAKDSIIAETGELDFGIADCEFAYQQGRMSTRRWDMWDFSCGSSGNAGDCLLQYESWQEAYYGYDLAGDLQWVNRLRLGEFGEVCLATVRDGDAQLTFECPTDASCSADLELSCAGSEPETVEPRPEVLSTLEAHFCSSMPSEPRRLSHLLGRSGCGPVAPGSEPGSQQVECAGEVFEFDGRGRLIRIGSLHQEYGEHGIVREWHTPSHHAVSYYYDKAGNLTASIARGGSPALVWMISSYSYSCWQ